MRAPILFSALLLVPAAGVLAADPEALREVVRETELAFAASVLEQDAEAFAALIAEDAVFLGGQHTHRGRDAIVEAWKGYFEPGAAPLRWEPDRVEVDDAGELAVSTGPYWFERPTEDGGSERFEGRFFSVWRRQVDGSWQVVFDSGTPPTLTAPAPAAGD